MLHFYHKSRSEYLYCGFFSKYIDFPAVKIDDFLTQAAEYRIKILANHTAPTVTSIGYGDETNNVLLQLTLIFDKKNGTKKTIPIQYKLKFNIAKQKMVPLPTAPVPPVSPLTNHPQK